MFSMHSCLSTIFAGGWPEAFCMWNDIEVCILLWGSSALEPSYLLRAVYPVLSSYETPDKQAYPRHSLGRAALITSGSPIFFLDAFTSLIVYYAPTADPSLPFPPPQNCK